MKKLIAYFSASGVTRRAARQLADVIGADIYEIRPEEPYSAADLDWTDKKSRSSVEMADASMRPAIAGSLPDISEYGTIYIGFPIWWGIAPRIISTFIEGCGLEGKKIVIFATSGGSSLPPAVKDLKMMYPSLDITGGKLLNGRIDGDIV